MLGDHLKFLSCQNLDSRLKISLLLFNDLIQFKKVVKMWEADMFLRASQPVYQQKHPFAWNMQTVQKKEIKPHLTQTMSSRERGTVGKFILGNPLHDLSARDSRADTGVQGLPCGR